MMTTTKSTQGAIDTLETLRRILKRDQAATMAAWVSDQEQAIRAILEGAGPLSERASGTLAVLAEFFLIVNDAGLPDLDTWRPIATQTPAEVASWQHELLTE